MTPEAIQILTYLAIAAGGYALRHFNLLSLGGAPAGPAATPAMPTTTHPVLDRILQVLQQSADDALTQAATQIVAPAVKVPTQKPVSSTNPAPVS